MTIWYLSISVVAYSTYMIPVLILLSLFYRLLLLLLGCIASGQKPLLLQLAAQAT